MRLKSAKNKNSEAEVISPGLESNSYKYTPKIYLIFKFNPK